jgi:hypothetical protein
LNAQERLVLYCCGQWRTVWPVASSSENPQVAGSIPARSIVEKSREAFGFRRKPFRHFSERLLTGPPTQRLQERLVLAKLRHAVLAHRQS